VKNFFYRVRVAWNVLRGRVYLPENRTEYVIDRPDYLVQLVYFQDGLIGLDGLGGLWKIAVEYDGEMYYEFMSEGPRRNF